MALAISIIPDYTIGRYQYRTQAIFPENNSPSGGGNWPSRSNRERGVFPLLVSEENDLHVIANLHPRSTYLHFNYRLQHYSLL
jgi:hypothetical protein